MDTLDPNNLNSTSFQPKSNVLKSFAETTANSLFPKKDQIIVFNTIEEVPQIEYIKAFSQITTLKNIKFASRISNNRFCIYFTNKDIVEQIISKQPYIVEINITDTFGTTSEPEEVAQKIGTFYQDNFSNKIYKQQFIDDIKTISENIPIISDINPLCPDQINLNEPFSIKEMEVALLKCRNKSPGPYGIPYCFIHDLGILPTKWKNGTIIPIIKPGKKNTPLTPSYGPITLSNTTTKTMEKIINTRLIWFLEKNKILNKEQSGFRQSRSTIDNLHIIKSEIDQAFVNKQTPGMVSLDISKAYDSVWRYRVIMLLSKILANGTMNNYIKDFLIDRHFQVKVSNSLSISFSQENGVSQGSSLAVTIFLLAINDIVDTIRTPVTANLFADDFNILIRSQNTNTVQYYLQTSIDSLSKTANQKYLKMFDTPLNTGLRYTLGGFKSSPIESLRNLANEIPPDLRRTYNTILYAARTLINIENPSNKYLAKNVKEAEEH
ncbi:hypothetical protein QTP88_006262 [Uroleucon formosanum]